ncbi:hypothetical protein TBLA_0A05280 [Henningerozyma blattae CBS 6284]|uniref:Plasma membrane fusion protein PRM1 n=1 Tax=Henningerozyma blattae (strain ATCC 34711 / CBS 6284 / DSM 70876 / NBRC 10599 / NRRL Y-10934 / UCD 77-7) TaxID=1071380 RepID=I2GW19_HENB6|nr:hypothetical protein TBLA_0A05280 [Tetrapisispora blattae CBS 6284]CCH58321.1 hypothetical protein TBLA_0A05280 [Tetrapisispora blattae CBS 6284]
MQLASYLQLNDRISQSWINIYTIGIMLVVVKLIFFYFSITSSMNTAQNFILSKCSTIDEYYNKMMENTPHYLGVMGNYLIEKSIEESVKASLYTLSLLVYASEELVSFMIDLYLGTYECLLVSFIDGTVDVATNATEKLIDFVNSSVGTVANELDDGLDDISKFINKIVKVADKVESFFTDDDDNDNGDSSVSKVNLTISGLRHLYIPSSIDDKLEELSAKTPNFQQLKNETKHLISIPFEKVRTELKTVNTSKYFQNKDMLYIPELKSIDTTNGGVCSDNKENIIKFFQNSGHELKITTIVCIVILIVIGIGAIIPIIWEEYVLWRNVNMMKQEYRNFTKHSNSNYTEMGDVSSSSGDSEYSLREKNPFGDVNVISNTEHFDIIESYQKCFNVWNTRITNSIGKIVCFVGNKNEKMSKAKQIQTRWIISYIFSERALCLLGVALLGILACILQFIIIKILGDFVRNGKNSSLAHSVSSLSKSSARQQISNELNKWGASTNDYIQYTETQINDDVFGWVNTTTTSINGTVNKMINGIDETLADIFNGTLLYKPMKTVVGCIIENKLYTIRNGLTWVHDKAEIKLPSINVTQIHEAITSSNTTTNSTSSDSSSTSREISNELSEFTQEVRNAILTILAQFYKSTLYELAVAFTLLGLWILQIPIALLRLRYHYKVK